MTKAERIFKATYFECRTHVKNWGIGRNTNGRPVGYETLITKDDESVSIRTCNAVQKFIESEKRRLERNGKFGVGTPESQECNKFALEMTQATLNNHIKHIRDFQAELKAI